MTPLYRQPTTPRRAFALFAVVAYLLAMGVVPAGHMAAPLASGTAFHLCPGDTRSALILDALSANAAPTEHHQHHHGHHSSHEQDSPATSDTEATDDSACPLGGASGAKLVVASADFADSDPASRIDASIDPLLRATSPQRWLRPPVRTPPA